jgi:hypothetical protein
MMVLAQFFWWVIRSSQDRLFDANLVITWSRNPQSRLRSDPGKPN